MRCRSASLDLMEPCHAEAAVPAAAALTLRCPDLSDREFECVRRLAATHAGLVIADHKRNMVRRRLERRLKALGLDSYEGYCRLVEGPQGEDEIQSLINALTTNKTAFFRESHHFDHLGRVALPRLVAAKLKAGSRRVRIWSAGCSTGQEAYTIAITLDQALGSSAGWDARILATDIDTDALAHARCGSYARSDLVSLPSDVLRRYTRPASSDPDQRMIVPGIRRLVTFKRLNLNGPWPMRGPFDAIFCRNVVIYFDKEHQRRLIERFASLLEINGLLYCGHSESLIGLTSRFRAVGKSLYVRIE